jgi:hypothetical protein
MILRFMPGNSEGRARMRKTGIKQEGMQSGQKTSNFEQRVRIVRESTGTMNPKGPQISDLRFQRKRKRKRKIGTVHGEFPRPY